MILAAASTHLPGVLQELEQPLDEYGYLAVAAFVMVEDFGVPLPGETVLVLASVYAATGRLNVLLVALVAFVAAVLGDNIGFAIGHFGGQRFVDRFGRYVFLTPERLAKATAFFERHGGKVVVVARFIEGLRQANGIIAGISSMPWARFLMFNAIGAALWVGVWVSVGYLSGSNINAIYSAAVSAQLYLAITAGVFIIALVARQLLRRRAAQGPPGEQ